MASCTAEAGASSANRTLCRGPLLRAGCSCAFELFFQQLFVVQIRVIAAVSALFVIFWQTEGDIAANGFAKQVSVLRNETDGLAESGERPFADRAAVDQDAVIGGFPETGDESGERGLAAARGADNGERGPRGNLQMNVAKDGMLTTAVRFGGAIRSGSGKSRWVSKGEMAEFDFATRLGALDRKSTRLNSSHSQIS